MTIPATDSSSSRGEHAGNIEPVAGFGDAIGETGTGPGAAGGDFRHHGADQRQAARDPQAAENVGQGGRQLQIAQGLQPRGAIELKQPGEIAVDGFQPERGVGEHREEADNPGAHHDRGLLRQVDQQQRRDRDHGA